MFKEIYQGLHNKMMNDYNSQSTVLTSPPSVEYAFTVFIIA